MQRFHFASFAFIFALMLFAGAFVVMNVPEAQALRSDDGAVSVTGLARTAQHISVAVDTSATIGDPLLGLVYRIEPSDVPLDAPIVLSFAKRADLGTLEATVVYQWNSSIGMWVSIPSVVADTHDVLAVEVLSLGDFALGVIPDAFVPSLLTAQDALRAKSPVGTRGYRLLTSYTLPNGVPVMWPETRIIGGCGGRIGAGDRTEYSSFAQTMNVLVNDVQTQVVFTVVGEWIVAGDGVGCPASLPLKNQEAIVL
ncbi:MAG: hypothetical protein WCT28_00905 [Patescibacteria group bacterium]|jgi:hypothetical protein